MISTGEEEAMKSFLKTVLLAVAIIVGVFLLGFIRPCLKAAAEKANATIEAAADGGK